MSKTLRILPIGRGPVGRDRDEESMFRSVPEFRNTTLEHIALSSENNAVYDPAGLDQIVQECAPDIVLFEAGFLPAAPIAALNTASGGPFGDYPSFRSLIFCRNNRVKGDPLSLKEFRVMKIDETYQPERVEVESCEKFLVLAIGPDGWLSDEQRQVLENIPRRYGLDRKAKVATVPPMERDMWLDMLSMTDPNVVITCQDVVRCQAPAVYVQLRHHRRLQERENPHLPAKIPHYLFKESGTLMQRLHLDFRTIAE